MIEIAILTTANYAYPVSIEIEDNGETVLDVLIPRVNLTLTADPSMRYMPDNDDIVSYCREAGTISVTYKTLRTTVSASDLLAAVTA